MKDELAVSDSHEPRIGLFWFIPSKKGYRFAGKSLPLKRVRTIGGIKTLDDGHPEVWAQVVKKDSSLRRYEYEYFPRGRVNWLEERNEFLIVCDPVIFAQKIENIIVDRFRLIGCNIRMFTDPHYRVNRLPTFLR